MAEFKKSDIKEIGKVQVSAKGLRLLADKIQQVRGTDSVVDVIAYLAPGQGEGTLPQLAYDVNPSKKPDETPKEEKPVAKVEEAKPAEKKAEEKPAETPKPQETTTETPKAEEPKATPAAAETPAPKSVETPAPTVEESKAKELEQKAKEITAEANKGSSSESEK